MDEFEVPSSSDQQGDSGTEQQAGLGIDKDEISGQPDALETGKQRNEGEIRQPNRRTVISVISALSALGITGIATFSWLRRNTSVETTQQRTSSSSCTQLTAELTQGPYYLDVKKIRSDVTESKPGVPLLLRITVVDSAKCTPIENAAVDIWHCDALGIYSGYQAASKAADADPRRATANGMHPNGVPPNNVSNSAPPNGIPPIFQQRPAGDNATFLRGIQLTNHSGVVEFRTIYPGWYIGRTTHIHVKVHVDGTNSGNIYNGGHVSHTGQFFFADEVCNEIGKLKPYVTHTIPRLRLLEDMFYPTKDNAGALLTLTSINNSSLEAGLLGIVTVTVNPHATPAAAPMRGPNLSSP